MNSGAKFRLTRILALGAAFVLVLAAPALADFSGGRQAEAEGDYETAAKLYRQSAHAGDIRSLTNLGVLYAKGRGVERDYDKAIALYREAALQGQSTAQYNLGLAYRRGRGVERDDKIAAKWFAQAAGARHAGAQYNLGLLYRSGLGGGKDQARAFDLFRRAADRGHAGAQYYLGLAFRDGIGVSANQAMATQWFQLAAKKQHVRAFYRLGRTHETGRGDAKVDLVESLKWYMLAAQYAKLQKDSSARKVDALATKRIETLVDKLPEDKIQEAQASAEAWMRTQRSGRT